MRNAGDKEKTANGHQCLPAHQIGKQTGKKRRDYTAQ
jgi:hypothetical protein